MRLIDLEIAGFGKLVNRKISFDEKLTVIYGLNEAGKSTVHACIRAMLFGMPRARGAAAGNDEYSRYKPWKTKKYGAVLRFEDAGHVFTVTRNFAEDPIGFTMHDETDGCKVDEPEKTLEHALCGMTRKTFENTVSIGQLKTSTDPGMTEELNEYLVNLNTAGDRSLSTEKAADYLNERKEELRQELSPDAARAYAANTAEIKKIEEELADLPVIDRLRLNDELKDIAAKIQDNSAKRSKAADAAAKNDKTRALNKKLTTAARIIFIPAFIFLAAAILSGLFGYRVYVLQKTGIPAAILFCVCLVAEIILRIIVMTKRRSINGKNDEELLILDDEAEKLNQKNTEITSSLNTGDIVDDRIAELIGRLNELRDRNLQLQETLTENDRINSDIEAIDIALSTMNELSDTMSSSFGHHLNEEASKYINELTNGAYETLSVDEELHAMLVSDDKMIPIDRLSAGTREQVYLAVRLAVAKLMQSDIGELRPLPLIFDDSFVNYDDGRLASAIEWIASAYSGQIIIFSCQFREMAVLDDLEIPHINIKL